MLELFRYRSPDSDHDCNTNIFGKPSENQLKLELNNGFAILYSECDFDSGEEFYFVDRHTTSSLDDFMIRGYYFYLM